MQNNVPIAYKGELVATAARNISLTTRNCCFTSGRRRLFRDSWLIENDLDVGSEWPGNAIRK